MKRILTLLACSLLLVLLHPDADAQAEEGRLRLVIATDLHYIAPELRDHGPYFSRVLENSDGKTSFYCEELTEAFLDEVRQLRPDALLLTGDLSFNGALESHRALADKLAGLEREGIEVLVLTGNHDLYNLNAARFEGDGFSRVRSAVSADFREIYGAFGYDEALSRDEETLSYYTELGDSLGVLMLDANTLLFPCALPDSTLGWAEAQLEKAQELGRTALVCCHQNLLQHSMFTTGYVLEQADSLLATLERCGVRLFLSGHLHMQHSMRAGTVTEITTSALCSYPCQYAVLDLEDGLFRYETRVTEVGEWAEKNGRTEPDLLNFREYAVFCFDRRTRAQAVALLPADMEEDLREKLTEYACEVNRCCFSGRTDRCASLDPDGSLRQFWEETGTLYGGYLASVVRDAGENYNILTVGKSSAADTR